MRAGSSCCSADVAGADAADGGAGVADGVAGAVRGLSCGGAADELRLQAFAATHLQATAEFGGDDHGRSGQLWLLRGWQTADDETKPATVLMLPLVPAA